MRATNLLNETNKIGINETYDQGFKPYCAINFLLNTDLALNN
jgi:hypothetical protein